jgi:hypothetical protein
MATRRVFNVLVDEAGRPLANVVVSIQLNSPRWLNVETSRIGGWGIRVQTDANGRWEASLAPNDLMDDPNSYYVVTEGVESSPPVGGLRRPVEYLIQVPSTGYTDPIWVHNLLITPPSVTPPATAVMSLGADNQPQMTGDIRLLSGAGVALAQDTTAKTITIDAKQTLLDEQTHTDTATTAVQRGMLIVGQLIGAIVKWAGLALGAAGKFLKSTGTDVVWDDVNWTDVKNTPPTFPPSPHTHVKADITDFAHTHVKADITDFAHTHPPSQISPQGSGSGLDADTVDGQHASAFAPTSHIHNAADIAAGQFGANTGGGDYSFSGNVGIGTTTPGAKLHIQDGRLRIARGAGYADFYHDGGNTVILNQHLMVSSSLSTPNITARGVGNSITIGWGNGTFSAVIAKVQGNPLTTGHIQEWRDYDNSLVGFLSPDKFYFAGNVGIGTMAPTHQLHLFDGSGIRVSALANWANIPNPGSLSIAENAIINPRGFSYRADGASLTSNVNSGIGIAINRSNPAVAIRNNSGPGLIVENGNVGIGTTAPNSKLHVAGSISTAITRKTANYTLTNADNIVICDASAGAFTISLPSAVGIAGRMYTIKKVDSSPNAVTVAPPPGQTIDGAASYVLSAQWKYVTVVSDGSNWFIIANN